MPICTGTFVRSPEPQVGFKVTSTDADALYALVVVMIPRDINVPIPPPRTFGKQQLADGHAQWQVPAYTRCEASLTCDRSVPLSTTITINGDQVFSSTCNANPAGLAGRWGVTVRKS